MAARRCSGPAAPHRDSRGAAPEGRAAAREARSRHQALVGRDAQEAAL